MILPSPSKINLALDILKKDPSGYHEMQTVFQEVPELYDELIVKKNAFSVEIKCENPRVPLDETNTIYKAVKVVQKDFKIKSGVAVYLKKNIPLASGLGGASSNAATVLKALDALWALDLNPEELQDLGAQVGMDVPFFILGGTALGTHFGEKIHPLPAIKNLAIKIIPTNIAVNTCEAYQDLDLSLCGKNRDKTQLLISGIQKGDLTQIIANIHNDFEESVFKKHPELKAIKGHLTGSGGGMFEIGNNFQFNNF